MNTGEKQQTNTSKFNLRNLPLKNVIAGTFGVLLLILVILGCISAFSIRRISSFTDTLYSMPHTNLVGMWEVKSQAAEAGSALLNSYINQTPVDQDTLTAIQTLSSRIKAIEANKVDKSQATSPEMQAILDNVNAWSSFADKLAENITADASSVTGEDIQTLHSLQTTLTHSVDGIIVTASGNALRFRDNASQNANSTIFIIVTVFFITVIYALLMLRIILRSISEPLHIMIHTASEIRQGNLRKDIPYHMDTEFGELADCFRSMKTYLLTVVTDIEHILTDIGNGNLHTSSNIEYIGDFLPIRDAIDMITDNLSSALNKISISADQVANGVNQLKNGAANLSEGATDQSAAVEELTATIESISQQVSHNAGYAVSANKKVSEIVSRILNSNEQMQKLKTAMEEISSRSREIGTVIKAIDEIAAQTNLLSLNASIEAARAGEAGRGFAVVANEVKHLAEQSSESAGNTTSLVENCISAIDKGTQIADETTQLLLTVAEEAKEIIQVMDEISTASQGQAQSISQITQGMEQISEVIQSNSTAADATASSSESLSELASDLEKLVGEFEFS